MKSNYWRRNVTRTPCRVYAPQVKNSHSRRNSYNIQFPKNEFYEKLQDTDYQTFECAPNINTNPHTDNTMQGILFFDGTVRIGIDVWRDLTKSDSSSYEYETFNSYVEMLEKYHPVARPKCYYL